MYYNDAIKTDNDSVTGTIGDLKEYFRYELANQCMAYGFEYENFRDNVENIMNLLDQLYEDTLNNVFTDNDIMKVSEHPMGGFMIERECD